MNVLVMTAFLTFFAAMAANAQTYRWTDSQGVIHFTDSYESIPAPYRHNVVQEEDITIQNPRIREEVKQEEERVRQDEASRLRLIPAPEDVPPLPPRVAPAKPAGDEAPPPRTKSERVRENVERREAEGKGQQPEKSP